MKLLRWRGGRGGTTNNAAVRGMLLQPCGCVRVWACLLEAVAGSSGCCCCSQSAASPGGTCPPLPVCLQLEDAATSGLLMPDAPIMRIVRSHFMTASSLAARWR